MICDVNLLATSTNFITGHVCSPSWLLIMTSFDTLDMSDAAGGGRQAVGANSCLPTARCLPHTDSSFSLVGLFEEFDDGLPRRALPQEAPEHVLLQVAEDDVH